MWLASINVMGDAYHRAHAVVHFRDKLDRNPSLGFTILGKSYFYVSAYLPPKRYLCNSFTRHPRTTSLRVMVMRAFYVIYYFIRIASLVEFQSPHQLSSPSHPLLPITPFLLLEYALRTTLIATRVLGLRVTAAFVKQNRGSQRISPASD